MNLLQTIEEITKEEKYYAGKCEQAYASMTVRAIRNGTAKQKTIESFLALFGYFKTVEKWERLKVENKLVALPNNHIGIVTNQTLNK